ncbi:hypothetical protein [Halorussus salinus]|uniref:hypothetical protein n=1 Tax=Halorussus salinus TaxID=1364935 RepID=UPI001092454E|nr:hypothetical protein [Halorussus salinus]
MSFREDNRGVSEQVGVVLIFAVLVILMSLWQAQVVPSENTEREFAHYIDVQEDMTQLRSNFVNAAETGTTRSTTIKASTTYPTRAFFLNPPPPYGELKAEKLSSGEISSTSLDIAEVCGREAPVQTRSIQFKMNYNYLSGSEAPLFKYENTVFYRETPDGTIIFENEPTLIQGSTINLYPLSDEFSQTRSGPISVDFYGAETGYTKVSGPVTLTIPTALPAGKWEEALESESNFVAAQQTAPQRVQLELANTTWNVQCAVVGTGQTPNVNVSHSGTETSDNSSTAFEINWQNPSSQSGTKPNCDADNCDWDVNNDSDNKLALSALTTPQLEGMDVHFGVTNSSVATITSSDQATDSNGVAEITLKAKKNGTVGVYVGSGGTSDAINITVTGMNQNSGLADPGFAYRDVNKDGNYDSGTDQQIPTAEVSDGQYNAGSDQLVIPDSIGEISVNGYGNIDLAGEGVIVETDLETDNGNILLDAKKGTLSSTDITVDSTGTNGKKITLRGNEAIDIEDSVFKSSSTITIDAQGGSVTAQGATLDSTAVNGQEIKVTANEGVDISNGEILASSTVTIDARGGALIAQAAEVNNENYNGKSITLKSNGNMNLGQAAILAGDQAFANLRTTSATLFVDGTTVTEAHYRDGKLEYSPASVTESPNNPYITS